MTVATAFPTPGDRREPCSDAARGRRDPLIATAPPTRRWLLLEVPAGWSEKLLNSRDIRGTREALARVVERQQGRVLFIRRPGRRAADTEAPAGSSVESPRLMPVADRLWVVVDAHTVTETTGRWAPADRHHPARLNDAIAAFDTDGPLDAPAATRLLVCTHGTHDQCCAVRGRPVAAALATQWPELVWECSHLGGDRFSGNLLVLPTGTYLGHLDAASATTVARAELAGRTPAEHLRGVSTQPPAVQAAVTEVLRVFGPYAAHLLRGRILPDPQPARSLDPGAGPPTAAGAAQVDVRVRGHPHAPDVLVRVTRSVLPPAQRACLADIEKVAITHTAMLAESTDNPVPATPMEN